MVIPNISSQVNNNKMTDKIMLTHVQFLIPNHNFPLFSVTKDSLISIVMEWHISGMDLVGQEREHGNDHIYTISRLNLMNVLLLRTKLFSSNLLMVQDTCVNKLVSHCKQSSSQQYLLFHCHVDFQLIWDHRSTYDAGKNLQVLDLQLQEFCLWRAPVCLQLEDRE